MKRKKIRLLCLAALLTYILCGCGANQQSEALNKTCAELADAVYASVDFQKLTDTNDKYMAKHLMVTMVDLEDWCLRMDATRATPELICILKAKPDADKKAVKKALEFYLSEQLTIYRDYQPDQAVKLEKAKIMENGAYLALVVSPDANKANAALGAGWK